MNKKDFTPQMRSTFSVLISKGYTYFTHTKDGLAIVSLSKKQVGNTSKYSWGVHFLDYNNFGHHWVTVIDPRKDIEEFYEVFKFERKHRLAWKESFENL